MAIGAVLSQVPPDVVRVIRSCANQNLWPLYLWGETGVGKTCAAAVAYSLWQQPAWWLSLTELCDALSGFNVSSLRLIRTARGVIELSREGFWHRFATLGLVVVDEIGTRDATAHRYDAMLKILECRNGRPLILTGNIDLKRLATVYDERIQSRIGAGVILRVNGDDLRLTGLENRIINTE